MKLHYYKGKNFGDAINPLMFEKLLPDFFDGKSNVIFVGVGSILGLLKVPDECQKIIVFSSGYADGDEATYGIAPLQDDRFDFKCVRGPLTAKKIGIDPEKAMSDGALLLPLVFPSNNEKKEYDFAYMPHHGSLDFFHSWKEIAASCGIRLIDPTQDPMFVLNELIKTRVLLTEAMHGAIVADAYRVNWIPIKTTRVINEFKWKDYLATVGMDYAPHTLPTLYSKSFIKSIFEKKLAKFHMSFLSGIASWFYQLFQRIFVITSVKRKFRKLKQAGTNLCSTEILDFRQKQLMKCLDNVKAEYKILNDV